MENRERVREWIQKGLLAEPLGGIKGLYENISLTTQRLSEKFNRRGFGYVTKTKKVLWFYLPESRVVEATMQGEVIREWDISSFPGQEIWQKVKAVCGAYGIKTSF